MGVALLRVKPGQMASEFADESTRAMLLSRDAIAPRASIAPWALASLLDTVNANKTFQPQWRRASSGYGVSYDGLRLH